MEHIKNVQIRKGVDVGYHSSNLHPYPRGIDESYTFEMVLNLAYEMENKPNIIIKAGPRAKWYLKYFQKDTIEDEIEKQKWRDTSRCTMYIIDWE